MPLGDVRWYRASRAATNYCRFTIISVCRNFGELTARYAFVYTCGMPTHLVRRCQMNWFARFQ